MAVLIETSLGSIVVDLYCEERPRAVLNFIKLCKSKFYNFTLFHSVQKHLVAQAGDPTGTGRGGESVFCQIYGEQAKYFDAERLPKINHHSKGLISMVDNGNGQHGSQFFITLADQLDYLDGKHTVFGQLAEGLEFLDRINEVYCDKEFRPYRNVRIHHTIVLDDPFEDPPGLNIPPASPLLVANLQLACDHGPPRLEEDEILDETVGLSPKQLEELQAEHEARTNAQLLTLIGDLPDANVKPPDNVLFVCRLNPVTTAEDLEIIFSRFGEIASCEVIRDKRTGASLQYAFIEFSNERDCENAFFKMDKVIIDDRRIHVDFSQSVAKQWQQHKQQKQNQEAPKREIQPIDPVRQTVKTHSDRNLELLKCEVVKSSFRHDKRHDHSRHHASRRSSERKHVKKHEDRHQRSRPKREESPTSELDVVLSDVSDTSSSESSSPPSSHHHHHKTKRRKKHAHKSKSKEGKYEKEESERSSKKKEHRHHKTKHH